jgi:hypothetical protein
LLRAQCRHLIFWIANSIDNEEKRDLTR